jgi:hypothetical protein
LQLFGSRSRVYAGALQVTLTLELPHQTFIGGQPALTTAVEYTDNGQKMAENLTWIATEHTTALFFARLPADDLEVFQVRFDQIIYSVTMP